MGNCISARQSYSIANDAKSAIEGHSQPTIEFSCQKKITYIRKHFISYITKEQKNKLHTIQKTMRELGASCKTLGISEEMHTVLFQSIHDQIKILKRKVENKWKAALSDYDAFLLKLGRENTPKLDIFDIIDIPKASSTPLTIEDLNNINFPILSLTNNSLMYLTGLVLKNNPFVIQQSIKSSKIDSFIEIICSNYNVTGYHNFSHAFSVFLMSNQSYNLSAEIKDHLSNFELFFMLVAGISHDLNHKGKNNAYHIKKRSQLSIIYSDQSVLENMHISTLLRLMSENPQSDLISGLKDPVMRVRAKKILFKCILATDMTTHFSSLKQFQGKCDATQESLVKTNDRNKLLAFQKDKETDRDLIMQMIIHACDIGNPCLQTKSYLNWAALLTHEFDQQNKREVFYGYEVTPMLQYTNKANFYKGQIGFSKHFVLPLWKQMSIFSPALKVFPDQIEQNINTIEQIR